MSDRDEIEEMVESSSLTFLIESQIELTNELSRMFERKYDQLSRLIQLGSEMLSEYKKKKESILNSHNQELPAQFFGDLEAATKEITEDFKNGLHKILLQYFDIKHSLKDGLEVAAKYDQVILSFDSAKFKAQELKQKLTFAMSFMVPTLPPLISTSDKSGQATDMAIRFGKPVLQKANAVPVLYRPPETEIITHIYRAIREMRILRNTLNTRPFVTEYTNKAIKQSKVVVNMLADQIPAQPIEKYLDTFKVPQSQRI